MREKHAAEAAEVKNQLDTLCPKLRSSSTLSQKVLRVLCSAGVDCVLVGLRHPDHVEDAIMSLGPEIDNTDVVNILEKVKWDPIHFIEGNPNE